MRDCGTEACEVNIKTIWHRLLFLGTVGMSVIEGTGDIWEMDGVL